MLTKITKMIPTTYYIVDGVEFEGNKLLETLDNIVNVFDSWVSEFEVDWRCAEKLFDLGYLGKKCIYHDYTLYHDTEDKKAEALLSEIINHENKKACE